MIFKYLVVETTVPELDEEGLFYILKYASAAAITLYITHQNAKITMELKDEGIGFEPEDIKLNIYHGLLAIRERAYALKGEFTIDTAIGRETCLMVSIPI